MFKQIYISILLGIFFLGASVLAGTFTPTPASPGASPYTLSDIYDRISSNTFSYSAHSFNPATTPDSTGITLTQLWNIIPPHQTLAAHGLDSGTLAAGIYGATDLTIVEPNLIAANIATGTSIFGVVGTYILSRAALGEPCVVTVDCQEGLYCGLDMLFTDRICTEGVTGLDNCFDGAGCVSGWCDSGVQKCKASGNDGTACGINSDCVSGNCDNYLCVAKLARGQSCTADSQCLSNFCHPNAWVCSDMDIGDPCSDPSECNSGYCNRQDLVCSTGMAGQGCLNGYDCRSNNCIGVCQLGGDGDSCVDTGDCGSSYYCSSEVCIPRLGFEEPCSSNEMCLSNSCLDSVCWF